MKRLIIIATSILLILCMVLTSCSTASKVNHNLSKDADEFKIERRVTFYNARTDMCFLEVEGYLSVSNDDHNSELVLTIMTGPNEYKKDYIYLNDNVLYTVEDISGTHEDPYHYKFIYHYSFPVNIEVQP